MWLYCPSNFWALIAVGQLQTHLESPEGSGIGISPAQLRRRFRAHATAQLYDESGVPDEGFAIYALSDPRDIRNVSYVGQTRSPRRRFLQHLNHAQLWV